MVEAENPRLPSTQPRQDGRNSDSQTLVSSSSLTKRNAALESLREARTRLEAAEAEMTKEREAMRAEADRRRAAVEAETARLAEDARQRIAGIVGKSAGRKRKRVGEADEEKLVSLREGSLLLGLLQCNLFL